MKKARGISINQHFFFRGFVFTTQLHTAEPQDAQGRGEVHGIPLCSWDILIINFLKNARFGRERCGSGVCVHNPRGYRGNGIHFEVYIYPSIYIYNDVQSEDNILKRLVCAGMGIH